MVDSLDIKMEVINSKELTGIDNPAATDGMYISCNSF